MNSGQNLSPPPTQPGSSPPPPRAFTQGLGTVFQFVGVMLFVTTMFVCCASSLLSRDTATHSDLTKIGWRFSSGSSSDPTYSAQRATTLTVMLGVFFGLALAGVGLGLQAQSRRAPGFALTLSLLASGFWLVQSVFFATAMRSVMLTSICTILFIVFAILAGMSLVAFREMRGNPPPAGLEILPKDYRPPYSHLHEEPPEVRLAKELEDRRRRLEVQQKELEMLEAKLKRRLQRKDE